MAVYPNLALRARARRGLVATRAGETEALMVAPSAGATPGRLAPFSVFQRRSECLAAAGGFRCPWRRDRRVEAQRQGIRLGRDFVPRSGRSWQVPRPSAGAVKAPQRIGQPLSFLVSPLDVWSVLGETHQLSWCARTVRVGFTRIGLGLATAATGSMRAGRQAGAASWRTGPLTASVITLGATIEAYFTSHRI